MAISEERKREIEEEEKLRLEVQEKTKKKKQSRRAIGCLVLILLPFILFRLIDSIANPDSSGNTSTDVEVAESPSIVESEGKYLDYSYTISSREEDGQLAVTFSPFLPRDDVIVAGAMLDVINKTYGKHTVTNLTPQIVERAGKNLVMFEGTSGDYYFLLIKEDTGEVHSFVYWVE